MTNIKLDCFNNNDFCQIISSEKSFLIDNPLEREFILEIFNQGANDCDLKLKSTNFSVSNDLKMANLTIISDNKILFYGSLMNFLEKETSLGSIAHESSVSYSFFVDLFSLILEEKKLTVNFNLLFNFECLEPQNNIQTVDLERKPEKSAVLSATSVNAGEEATSSSHFFESHFYFLPLSILFVIVFFVIMKFIHGQKSKKQTKNLVKLR